MTKISYTINGDYGYRYVLFKYVNGACQKVFTDYWSRTENTTTRFSTEVDIPDTFALLFTGGDL